MSCRGYLGAWVFAVVVPGAAMATQAARTETVGNPLSASLRQLFQAATHSLLLAADLAPAEIYSYRPAADARSFGEQIEHATGLMYQLCAVAAGSANPFDPGQSLDGGTKADVVAESARRGPTAMRCTRQ